MHFDMMRILNAFCQATTSYHIIQAEGVYYLALSLLSLSNEALKICVML